MNMKRTRIISVLLVVVMIFSMAAFTSCNKAEKSKQITVNLKLAGSGEVYWDRGLMIEGLSNELTVLNAITKICDILDKMTFEYDAELNVVKKIGKDVSGLFESEYETEPVGEEGGEDGEEETTENPENIISDFYYDWVITVNGAEANLNTIVKENDKIECIYKEVPKEYKDKKK